MGILDHGLSLYRAKNSIQQTSLEQGISWHLYAENLKPKIRNAEEFGNRTPRFEKEVNNNNRSEKSRRNRPNTAVRRHVRRITEDFMMTQVKFENSTKSKIVTFDIKKNDDLKTYSENFHSSFSQKSIVQPSACTKCCPVKNQVMPIVTAPPIVNKIRPSSMKIHNNSLSASRNPQRRPSWSTVSRSNTANTKQLRSNENTQNVRPHRKRISKSANSNFYSTPKIPFEQMKIAKQFVEKAVLEGKVFSLHGGFPAIREALVKRGWVEKAIYKFPYINPHPQHCVCAYIGWTNPTAPLNPHNIPHSHNYYLYPPDNDCSSSTSQSPTNGSCSSMSAESAEKFSDTVEAKDELNILDKEKNSILETNVIKEKDIETEDGGKEEEKGLEGSSMETEEVKECKIEQLSDAQEQDVADETSESMAYNEIYHDCQDDPEENRFCKIDIDENNPEYFTKISKTINTAILGPAEIREGMQKAISKKNLSIFQYSVPLYEKKPKPKPKLELLPEPEEEEKVNEQDMEYSKEEEFPDIVDSESTVTINKQPFNPYPKLDYILTPLDKPVVTRVLRNIEPNFIWSWNKDSISYKHLSKDQLVNRFPNTPFTTKYGLCQTLKQLHWFSEASTADTFVPRAYCIGDEDEREAFIHDYRTTACLNILKYVVEGSKTKSTIPRVVHPLGEVPMRRVRQALQHIERFIQSSCHDDLDTPPYAALRECEWDTIMTAHNRLVHQRKRVKAPAHFIEPLIADCQSALERVTPFWPQFEMDGLKNVWIVKPGAQSRGRGIFLLNRLEDILALVQSPLIYQTKYVVQKYMERPLLIYNTKFDIRQWFVVTDWNPLTLWMYKECYLRFGSQPFDLSNNDEAIHLTNNAIQCKYIGMNTERDDGIPDEYMWDSDEFRAYLSSQGHPEVFDTVIYPGMKNALIATMLAAQVQMESFKYGFELFGADFMLTEDYRTWLIEINCSPCMAPTTKITKRMCSECLHDIIKVVIDYKQNKTALTGNFELIYQEKDRAIPNPPYLGVNLQITGRHIWRLPVKQDRRRHKRIQPLVRGFKSLPLIQIPSEENRMPVSFNQHCQSENLRSEER